MKLKETFTQLEEIIGKLEAEQISVEESLIAFEKGINLTREAQGYLREVEQKLHLLQDVDGKPESAELDDKAVE